MSLAEDQARVLAAHAAGASGLATARGLAEAMDGYLIGVYAAAAETRATGGNPRVALVALGGQGRGQRSPQSDVDVLLLHDEAAERMGSIGDRFLYPLWNAGLELGHGVRTVAESLSLCERDEAALTSHLDARLLAGDPALFARLRQALAKRFAKLGPSYVHRVLEPIRERAFAETLVFVLEPNLKTGPGGLRDIHQIGWVGGFRYGTTALAGLCERGAIGAHELRQLLAASSFYLRARTELHLLAGRRQDQLTFELHEELADRLHLRAGGFATAVEHLLSRHYHHARQVMDVKHRFLLRIDDELSPAREKPVRVAERFIGHRGRISLASEAALSAEPHDLLGVFVASLAHDLPIADATFDAIMRRRHLVDEAFRRDPAAAQLFWTIVDHPHGDRALFAMHQTGLLGRYLPEFGRVTSKVQADFYHTHTVDVHTLRLLALLYELRRGGGEARFSGIVRNEASFRSLVMGCFFHDAGKGSGRDHAEYGAELVEQAMVRLHAPLADIEDAQLLVREHLTMMKLSQRRDLSDAAMIASFAALVGCEARLDRLYVLSYVDTHSTGPTLWTPWKAALLEELYERTRAFFRRDPPVLVAQRGEGLPERMSRVLEPGEVETLLAARARGGGVVLAPARHGYRPLYVAAKDRPGLLAMVAGICAERRLSIASAELFSGEDGWALDRFMVRYEGPSGDPDEAELSGRYERLRGEVERALGEWLELEAFEPPPFRPPFLLPEVKVRLGESTVLGQVVEVFAPDRPGLLFDLSRTLYRAGYSIAVARISTEGARAVDVFYLRPSREDALPLSALAALLEQVARPRKD